MTNLIRIFWAMLITWIGFIASSQTNALTEKSVLNTVRSVSCQWRNVRIVTGGFVDGIIFHPRVKDVIYLRTDMGGAYRWSQKQKEWIPITDGVSQTDWNMHGIESLALDPQNANRVYLAAGTYTQEWASNGAILRSKDQGKSWQRTDMPFKMGGNEDGRSAGERLSVDPNQGNILYLGTRHDGLWRSVNYGETWNRITSFPVPPQSNGIGIVWIVFDPSSSIDGKPSSIIYAGVQQIIGPGIYISIDGGSSWAVVPGQPLGLLPHQAQISSEGELYATYADSAGPNGMTTGAVWKYSPKTNSWKDISPLPPKSGGFAGLSIDRAHPGTIVVSTMDRWGPGDDIFLSTNGGGSWVGLKDSALLDAALAPFLKWGAEKPKFGWWIGSVALDPFRSEHLLFGTGATIWETSDLKSVVYGKPTHWVVGGSGVEQTAVIDFISPPKGAHLISALGDITGFRHDDLEVSPIAGQAGTPITGTMTSLDFAEQKPNIVVRSGSGKPGIHGVISKNGGSTWKAFESEPPGIQYGGNIAISSDGSSIVWAAQGSATSYSRDGGITWKPCLGLPKVSRPISDRVDGRVFYALDGENGSFLVSEDGGAHFNTRATGLPHLSFNTQLHAVFGHRGDIWFTGQSKLYHSVDGGRIFTHIPTTDRAEYVGFGKAAPGRSYPAVYLIGAVAGVEGIFRSDDIAADWVRINDSKHQFGPIGPIIGDPRIYGRVYLGSNGRGILYADPVSRSW